MGNPKMIGFRPGKPVIEVPNPPALDSKLQAQVTVGKIVVACLVVFVISVVIVDRVLWPAIRWAITLLGW